MPPIKQLALSWRATRYELPGWAMSWRVGDVVRRAVVGEYCIDEAWPWWKPGQWPT